MRMENFKVTGTLVKNFFHCKRQAFLFFYGLNFESESMRIGEILHEEKGCDEFVFDGIRVDKIDFKRREIVEFKKSFSNLEGSCMQVLFYLFVLRGKGLFFSGRIVDLEFGDEYEVVLDDESLGRLKLFLSELQEFLRGECPDVKRGDRKGCEKCSFFEFCFC